MNKHNLLFAICLIVSMQASAQDFTLGARGGLNQFNSADINSRGGSLQGTPPDVLFTPVKEFGTQYGGYVLVEFGKLFVRPEINFANSKNKYEFPQNTSYWKTSELDIPILFGYEIFKPISIYAGPGFNNTTKISLDGVQVTSYSDGGPDLKTSNVNMNVGIAVKFNRFGLDLRYEMGSKETEEELLDIVNSNYGVNLADQRSFKPNTISLSFTIDIISTKEMNLRNLFTGIFSNNKCHCPYGK